jgi:hypothetical protein
MPRMINEVIYGLCHGKYYNKVWFFFRFEVLSLTNNYCQIEHLITEIHAMKAVRSFEK